MHLSIDRCESPFVAEMRQVCQAAAAAAFHTFAALIDRHKSAAVFAGLRQAYRASVRSIHTSIPYIFHLNISLHLNLYCSCDTRYVGDYCEHRNPCLTGHGRCQNGGTCQVAFRNGRPGISCLCPLGFEESLCEIAVANACDQARCYNGGTCQLKTLQDYSCICANGYTGKFDLELDRQLIKKFTNRSILFSSSQAITARHRICAPVHHAAMEAPAPPWLEAAASAVTAHPASLVTPVPRMSRSVNRIPANMAAPVSTRMAPISK